MRWALLTVGSLLILDTLLAGSISNPNLGVFLPALLGAAPLLVGLFYGPCLRWFASPFGRGVRSTLIAGYALFFAGFAIVSTVLVRAGGAQPERGAPAVIVLGGGLKGGRPSGSLARRLDKALEYAEANPETLIVTTGGLGAGQTVTEGKAMEEYLVERGFPRERILREETSTSTEENLRNAAALLEEEKGLKPGEYRVVISTTDYHVFRALRVARRQGLNAEGLGSRSSWYLKLNFYLREYLAVLAYGITGRL